MSDPSSPERGLPVPDLREHGGPRDGVPQAVDRRLFMHLRVFGGCADIGPLKGALETAPFTAVLYEDANDPHAVGLLTLDEDPDKLHSAVRPFLNRPPFADLAYQPGFTMLGRTYALGYEPDLAETLVERPRRTVLNPSWPWAVWYPLRRSGAFAKLPEDERRAILREHGTIGMSFGRADLAHDIRLACFGLDTDDNDFVVGLLGARLHPLSAVVEAMRQTRQTSEFISHLGPFFIGRVAASFDR